MLIEMLFIFKKISQQVPNFSPWVYFSVVEPELEPQGAALFGRSRSRSRNDMQLRIRLR
jgi:hypothetical protein